MRGHSGFRGLISWWAPALVVACSSDVIESTPSIGDASTKDAAAESTTATSCIPGESRACAGPGACPGFQVCSADGTRLQACDCTASGSGGSGPSTGATGGTGGIRDAGVDVSTGGATSSGGAGGATGTGGTIGVAGQTGGGGVAGAAGQAPSCGWSEPRVVALAQASPQGIFIDTSNVYWANQGDGRIIKSALGQDLPTVHQSGLSSPFAIASANVWTELGPSAAQGSVALKLVATSEITRVSDQNRPVSVVSTNSGYAWGTVGDGTVRYCAGTTSPCTSPTTLAQGQDPVDMAARSDVVYWVNRSLGTVVSCPTSGCSGAPAEIVSGQDQPHTIAVDQYAVYFATSTEIRKCALTGCADAAIPVVTGVSPVDIALSASSGFIYWTDSTDRAVVRAPIQGATATYRDKLVCDLTNPNQIAFAVSYNYGYSRDSVYWTNGDGRVLRWP